MNKQSLYDAMHEAGCSPASIINLTLVDEWQRFDLQGEKTGKRSGWLMIKSCEPRVYVFGNWKTGSQGHWKDESTPSSPYFNKTNNHGLQQAEQKEQEKANQQQQAKCLEIWQKSQEPSLLNQHPYLLKKQVPAVGIRQLNRTLVVPVYATSGNIQSLQFIDANGNKTFKKYGKVKSGFHWLSRDTGDTRDMMLVEQEGQPITTTSSYFDSHLTNSDIILICEGYATAASLWLASNLDIVCAFNAGNLANAAISIKQLFPNRTIVIAADNDVETEGNPGLTSAKHAAQLIQAKLIWPSFETSACGSDFNDYHVIYGLPALQLQLNKALAEVCL